jgi:IS605 OrfB family transposase
MIRSSKHTLKFSNQEKLNQVNRLYEDYKIDLQHYVDCILRGYLPLKLNLSSKLIPSNRLEHSQYKQIIYKQASALVRGTLQSQRRIKKDKSLQLEDVAKIGVQETSIDLDQRLIKSLGKSKEFNEFFELKLLYFHTPKKRALKLNLPIKHHKHPKQFKTWTRKNTIKLTKDETKNQFYFIFTYEKEESKKKDLNNIIGVDQGYKKLISTSDGVFYGQELYNLYQKISNRKQGSKGFKRSLRERDLLINQACNELVDDNKDLSTLVIEDLKRVKHSTKVDRRMSSKLVRKLQRWSYSKVVSKLEMLSETKCFRIIKVNPAYTSQTCSNCGVVDKDSRQGESYNCTTCNYETDADYNASRNILLRGVALLKEGNIIPLPSNLVTRDSL